LLTRYFRAAEADLLILSANQAFNFLFIGSTGLATSSFDSNEQAATKFAPKGRQENSPGQAKRRPGIEAKMNSCAL
jgi:hypothetical protein